MKGISKKNSPIQMNRALMIIIMVGYMAMLILLLFVCLYLIAQYQNENKDKVESGFNRYMDELDETTEMLDRFIYDLYAYNRYFDKLSGNLTDLENYQNAYYLRETMQNKFALENEMHGYLIKYDRLSKSWYRFETADVSSETAAELNVQFGKILESGSGTRSWNIITIGDEHFLMVCSKKENAAIGAVHKLTDIKEKLARYTERDVNVILLGSSKTFITGSSLGEKLNAREYLDDTSAEFSGSVNGYSLFARRHMKSGLWVSMAIEYNLWSFMNLQQLFLVIITLSSGFAVVVLYRFLKRQLLIPLKELTGLMNGIKLGEIKEIPLMDVKFKELSEVNTTLKSMVEEIEKQKLLVYEEIIEKQRAQMQYLQLQLKPHFYLNNLKTLNALALENENQKIQELIFSLSAHLRYLLQGERELVSLEKEVDFAKNYVNLQKHVTGREVVCSFQIDDNISEWNVPMLCIQTFIENSIKYAKLGSVNMPLILEVSARVLHMEGERFLDITVRDNGQGYSEEVLEEINGDTDSVTLSVGINNIKRRCKILYGGRAEFHFENSRGAVSEIIYPEIT